MTQIPQPPTNEPEPLDAAERELARMLGSLPSGSPPPELDARILAAARRAVQQQPKRRPLGWWRSIGVGAAASAVLAVGLLVKLHGDGQGPLLPAGSDLPGANVAAPEAARDQAAPAAAAASATTGAEEPAPQHAGVPPPPKEIPSPPMPARSVEPELLPAPAPPSPSAPVAAPMPAQAQPIVAGTAAAPAANAFPAEEKAERRNEAPAVNLPAPAAAATAKQVAPTPMSPPAAPPAPPPPPADGRGAAADALSARQQETRERAADTKTERDDFDKDTLQAQKKPAPAAGGMIGDSGATNAADAPKAKNPNRLEVTGSRIKRSVDTEPTSPVTTLSRLDVDLDEESELAPMQWLDRIRQHVKSGDDALARASLQRFHTRYPDAVIPYDLQSLLQQ